MHQRRQYGNHDYGRAWRRLRQEVLQEQPFCGCGALSVEVDHIVPRRQGGQDVRENVRALCKSCHSRRTASMQGYPVGKISKDHQLPDAPQASSRRRRFVSGGVNG